MRCMHFAICKIANCRETHFTVQGTFLSSVSGKRRSAQSNRSNANNFLIKLVVGYHADQYDWRVNNGELRIGKRADRK